MPCSVEPFSFADWPAARRIFLAGYPETPAGLWDAGFKRMQEVPPGPADAALGVLLRKGGNFSGVALMIPGGPARRVSAPPQINASSWFIAPEARKHAMLMARHSMPDPHTVYTALTPIPSASRILRRIGFKAICCQTILGLTPLLFRLPGTGARMLGAADALAALAADPIAPALIDHQRLGCLIAALDTGDALLPLVFRPRRRWRCLPVAELMYTPSQASVAAHVGVIARHLLAHGFPMLEFDADEDLEVPFRCTRLFRRRLARGPYELRGIDYLYSELIYLHR